MLGMPTDGYRMNGPLIVYCTGEVSYDERCALPLGVYSTLEKAKESFGAAHRQWRANDDGTKWYVPARKHQPQPVIARYVVDA